MQTHSLPPILLFHKIDKNVFMASEIFCSFVEVARNIAIEYILNKKCNKGEMCSLNLLVEETSKRRTQTASSNKPNRQKPLRQNIKAHLVICCCVFGARTVCLYLLHTLNTLSSVCVHILKQSISCWWCCFRFCFYFINVASCLTLHYAELSFLRCIPANSIQFHVNSVRSCSSPQYARQTHAKETTYIRKPTFSHHLYFN